MEDQRIIELYFSRDEAAIAESERKYGGYCFQVAQNILVHVQDSEECVNDTWLRAWNSIPPERPRSLKCFLARITRNLSLDRFREKNAEKRGKGEYAIALSEVEAVIMDGRETDGCEGLTEDLERFLRTLPARECNIFILRYFRFDSTATIARAYGLKEDNVLAILSRTRKKLKKFLEKEGYTL